jgi:hypothetical protein
MGSLNIGSSNQNFSILFDTGSFVTWVRSSKCRDQVCLGRPSFNANNSTTYNTDGIEAPQIDYADGSFVQGYWVTDTVSVSSASADDFRFMEATSISDDYMDGLVGMSKDGDDLFFDALLDGDQLSSNMFSYWYNELIFNLRVHKDNERATMVFGGVDEAHINGQVKWLQTITDNRHWAVRMSDIRVTNTRGTISTVSIDASKHYVLFDTGTSVSYLSISHAKNLNVGKLGLTLYQEVSSPTNMIYYADCAAISTLPQVTFTFDDQLIYVSPDDYILVFGVDDPVCVSSFFGSKLDEGQGMLLGNSILRRWYTVFDKSGGGRIGLAEAVRGEATYQNLTVIDTAGKLGVQSTAERAGFGAGVLVLLHFVL